LHLFIDADGSPTGFVAWYNHRTDRSRIRNLRPMIKNSNYAVQRMEMLAIYFALLDNRRYLTLRKFFKINIRSDSKSTIEQLRGRCEIKDTFLQRIYDSINRLLHRIPQSIKFSHVRRNKNIAGIMLEEKRRRVRDTRMHMTSFLTILLISLNQVCSYRFSLFMGINPLLTPAGVHMPMQRLV
jgi:ribonuclease HI